MVTSFYSSLQEIHILRASDFCSLSNYILDFLIQNEDFAISNTSTNRTMFLHPQLILVLNLYRISKLICGYPLTAQLAVVSTSKCQNDFSNRIQ
jgi:hypothetical protein